MLSEAVIELGEQNGLSWGLSVMEGDLDQSPVHGDSLRTKLHESSSISPGHSPHNLVKYPKLSSNVVTTWVVFL